MQPAQLQIEASDPKALFGDCLREYLNYSAQAERFLILEDACLRINIDQFRDVDFAIMARSSVERERLFRPSAKWFDTVPALCVVISSGRVPAPEQFFERGMPALWIVDPESQTILQLRESGEPEVLDSIGSPGSAIHEWVLPGCGVLI